MKLKGKPLKVSREQVRAFLHASLTVLGYHNLTPRWPLKVSIVKRINVICIDGNSAVGLHCQGVIKLLSSLDAEVMLMTCLHECIHACASFPDGTEEKCVSTLTARLKPDVSRIAAVLLEGTYKRAAFIAHTKISYQATDGDFYDEAQHTPVGVKTKYRRTA